MRRLLSLGLAALLAAGLFVTSPIKGSITHPQQAGACGWVQQFYREADYGVFDYYYYQNTTVRFYEFIYTDRCGDYQSLTEETIDDGSPASYRSVFWNSYCGGGVGYSNSYYIYGPVVYCPNGMNSQNWEGSLTSYVQGSYLSNGNIVLYVHAP